MESVVLAFVVGMAVLMIVVGIAGWLQLKQIHAAVNSNMTTALNKIEDLHARVAELVMEARHAETAKRRPKKR